MRIIRYYDNAADIIYYYTYIMQVRNVELIMTVFRVLMINSAKYM